MNIKYTITKAVDKVISKEKQNDIKYYFRIGLVLLIIASVTATLLAFVNALTKERIAENEFAVMQEAVERIFEGSDGIKSVETEVKDPITAVYEVYKGDELMGNAIQVSPVGFKEAIVMLVGVDKDGQCLGVEIISISDTPGVGTKVKEADFLKGFVGLEKENIDSAEIISGSTVSSSAVKAGVAAALEFKVADKTENTEENFDENVENFPEIDEEIVFEETDAPANEGGAEQ